MYSSVVIHLEQQKDTAGDPVASIEKSWTQLDGEIYFLRLAVLEFEET